MQDEANWSGCEAERKGSNGNFRECQSLEPQAPDNSYQHYLFSLHHLNEESYRNPNPPSTKLMFRRQRASLNIMIAETIIAPPVWNIVVLSLLHLIDSRSRMR
jgi:hypothetical protein